MPAFDLDREVFFRAECKLGVLKSDLLAFGDVCGLFDAGGLKGVLDVDA